MAPRQCKACGKILTSLGRAQQHQRTCGVKLGKKGLPRRGLPTGVLDDNDGVGEDNAYARWRRAKLEENASLTNIEDSDPGDWTFLDSGGLGRSMKLTILTPTTVELKADTPAPPGRPLHTGLGGKETKAACPPEGLDENPTKNDGLRGQIGDKDARPATTGDLLLVPPEDAVPSGIEDSTTATANRGLAYDKKSSTGASTSIQVDTYEESTNVGAEQPLMDIPHRRWEPLDIKDPSIYWPFSNATDHAMANWFMQSECTVGDINKFFRNVNLAPIHDLLSFKNADECKERLHHVEHGGENNMWIHQPFQLPSTTPALQERTYTVQYRGVVDAIRFLLGHPAFDDNLVYQPVRQWNIRTKLQVYSEFHSGQYWWRKQGLYAGNATIIPVFVSTDKTVLTRMHSDKMAYPMYLTIGNLDGETRRSQTRPGTLLIGFLPVVKSENTHSRANVYHRCLEIIFKR